MAVIKALRSPRQAYKHVLNMLEAGRLGAQGTMACVYSTRNNAKNCAVGCLFTEDQLADLKRRRLNHNKSVRDLVNAIGYDNIVYQTGLEIDRLTDLQGEHDKWAENADRESAYQDFKDYLLYKIKGARNTPLTIFR